METARLRRFAQFARRTLLEQVDSKLAFVLEQASAARRESPRAVAELEQQIEATSRNRVVERVAYTWFNRFCALRYMDLNGYTRIRVVSPASEGDFQPEVLAEAKAGHIDPERVPEKTRARVFALLGETVTSKDPQQEAYRLLVVAECNSFHRAMPYLFEHISDYTELLMPDDLLSGNSILAYVREAMTPETCQSVEVIGWLYQFYISEKKDAIFEAMKRGKKITPDGIPAATQLFTPHWVVRYLVENSLGRLWMLNRPDSKLFERMDYYIRPEKPETDFPRIANPEDIKVCDPACGSGHMLTYAFDLLYAIYEEAGADAVEIPNKILTYNLYGIEIDERAADLAAFALSMKARGKQRRFFSKNIEPHICVLESIRFSDSELDSYSEAVGRGLLGPTARETLGQFAEADNFGSLIRPKLTNAQEVLARLEQLDPGEDLFLQATHRKVINVMRQASYLGDRYQVVVANPPYMGRGGMNSRLKSWVENQFPHGKLDLMTCFMERAVELLAMNGFMAMINIPSWMFLSSFESLRRSMLANTTISSLVHLGRGVFGSDFGTVAFCIQARKPRQEQRGIYRRLFEAHVQVRSPSEIEELFLQPEYNRFSANQLDFLKLPSAPIAYWTSEKARRAFERGQPLSAISSIGKGLDTGDNERFLKFWHEPARTSTRWVPCQKGGPFRKWYGNNDFVIDWGDDGSDLKSFEKANLRNSRFYFQEGGTWTRVTSGSTAFRYFPSGQIFESTGPCLFTKAELLPSIIGFLNSRVTTEFLKVLAPTLDFQSGHISNLPYLQEISGQEELTRRSERAIALAKDDWDSNETSWDFQYSALLHEDYHRPALADTYEALRAHWREVTLEMQRVEEENNQLLIQSYDLQDEMNHEVPLAEITLTCNPHHRYGGNRTEPELEALLLADTLRELISYGVGCMFGRYSLDEPGLVLAGQANSMPDDAPRAQSRFTAEHDNVIPLLDGDWFNNDVTERFQQFLRVTFGDSRYAENLQFIEKALGKELRKFFLKDFYNDHIKRYKGRPIYWLFSSPKGSFNALIYAHRYRPDTVGVVLEYLRNFQEKLSGERKRQEQLSISPAASQSDKTRAIKSIDNLKKVLAELDDYERDVLHPLATRKIAINLDDGVKVNYLELGTALKKVPRLETKEGN